MAELEIQNAQRDSGRVAEGVKTVKTLSRLDIMILDS